MKVDMTVFKTEHEMLQRLEDAVETEIVRELSGKEGNTYTLS